MGKKSGKAGKAVPPTASKKPEDADIADPGKVAEIKAEQRKTESGKYGSQKVKPHKPPSEEQAEGGEKQEEEQERKTSWIEIELVGEDDEPIPGEKCKITLPDDTVAERTLDEKGCTRVEGFEKGTCKICFPELDEEAWEEYGAARQTSGPEGESGESPAGEGRFDGLDLSDCTEENDEWDKE